MRLPDARGAFKRLLAELLGRFGWASWVLRLGTRLFAPRRRVGAVALIERDGLLLVARHVFRPEHPWGLAGGWLRGDETPEAGLERELREELGVRASAGELLLAAPHAPAHDPGALTLVYRVAWPAGASPRIELPFELLEVRWLPPTEAVALLRGFEVEALRRARPELDLPAGAG